MNNLTETAIKNIKKEAINFLRKYKMYYDDIDAKRYIELFLLDMKNALEEKESSLKMFPTFIKFKNKIPVNKPVIVLDAGGTNFRSAVVTFNEMHEPIISKFRQSYMPGLREEVSKDEFFRIMIKNIKDILDASDSIGFVFSYPTEIFPDRDGKLVRFCKEIKAKEVEGQFIGKNLLAAAKKYGFKGNRRVVILNDTVASLLSGLLVSQKRQFESFMGFVLGTGLNACYIEKNSNIRKKIVQHLDPNEYQLINIEAGNFDKGPRGDIDLSFDKKLLDPGMYTYEKMFSGAYLGGLATEVVKLAIKDKLFSDSLSREFENGFNFESRDIDDYLYYPPESENFKRIFGSMSLKDRVFMYYLFDNLVERASVLASIILASAIIKSDKGKNPCNPICIIAEGSSFYKMKNFQSRVDHYLKKILSAYGDYHYEIHRIDNAIILGAAVAALTNWE